MRILLTGARAPVTLDLVRRFHHAGHEVYLADSIHLPLARPARGARKTFVVSRPASNPKRYVEDLVQIVRTRRIDLLIPTCEEIYFIAARRKAFDGLTKVFAEPLELLRRLHNKAEFVELVNGIAGSAIAPESYQVASAEELEPWAMRDDTAEWVFKPIYSRFAARTLIGPTTTEVARLRPTKSDVWLAQRRIHGQEYSTYGIARAGRLQAHVCYRSKYRAGPGSGIYFIAEDHPIIPTFVSEFVRRISFTGQIGFDFIAADDRLYVLECNPRATSGLHLLTGDQLVDSFLGSDLDDVSPLHEPTSNQPQMLGAIMLMYALPQVFRRGGLVELVRDLSCARDVMFAWDDPLPTLLAPLSLVEVMYTALKTRKPLTRAATFDIEWNGEPL
jgi:predicted ATP-grasp superfamily ATP-dependent carboligase